MRLTRRFKSCDFKQNDYNEYIRLNVIIFRCGKLKDGCFLGLIVLLLASLNLSGRTPPDVNDPVGFFSSVADKMLRSTFSFGVTNIPVCSNGVFVYSPAVQRILQLSANVYDASNTNFFPTVFRPVFWVTNESGYTNVYVNGYLDVSQYSSNNTLTIGLPPLDPPADVTSPLLASNAQLTNYYGNVYGVPWIIGAKKGFPSFNQLYMNEVVQITRKLEVTRRSTNSLSPDYRSYDTNQMYVMSITNNIGISFWNSYSNFYPRPLTVYASDWLQMTMSNGAAAWVGNACFVIPSVTINPWPGSQWGAPGMVLPGNTPNIPVGSFYFTNWSYAFLPESFYRFASSSFVPNTQGVQWETNLAPCELPPFPQFTLTTTNSLQAYIVDGNNVIDYVQLCGPIDNTNVNQVLADPDYPDFTGGRYQWSTNLYQPPGSLTYGVYNQIEVSEHADASGLVGKWVPPAGLPASMGITPQSEAAFFNGFFAPNFQFNGQNYTNSQACSQAPFTPTKTMYNYILWQANDPLVHYLASDLNYVNPATIGWKQSDNFQLPIMAQNAVGQRFQPWGLNRQMAGFTYVDSNAYNLAFKDPLIWCPDNWNFPTNLLLTLGGLGQVHRGTPWQTVYLKAANILNEYSILGNLGTNTWMLWTGDTDPNDAALMAPANDWRLAGLLISLLNTNDATQLLSVNDPNIADWLNVLNGLTVYSNSVVYPHPSYTTAPQFVTYVIASNSPQTLVVANGIAQVRVIQPNQLFYFIGDILATPELTEKSPWLNTNSSSRISNQLQYGITDAAYEAIPTQLLLLLRPDSIGAISPTNDGWSLQFSGSDSYAYALQTSTNLVNWDTVSTNYPVQGRFDTSPLQNSSARYYRTVLLP
jgi:hypothetical protein